MEQISLEGQWIQWKPTENLSPKYYITSISDNLEGLTLLLSDAKNEEKCAKITFNYSVHSYRRTDESFRMKTVNDLYEKHGSEFYGEWTFFKIENSQYISWLSEQSYEIAKSEGLIHFVLVAADSLVDIIAAYEPKVELL